MKLTTLAKTFTLALMAAFLTIPLAGCGVESEPIGVEVEDDGAMEDPAYIEGEEGT